MKIFNYRGNRITKAFLIAASCYRRMSGDSNLDFSLDDLQEQYIYESTGGEIPSPRNGYSHGKWVLDATLSAIKQDLESGLMCKADFTSSPAFIRRAIRGVTPKALFAYRKC